MKGIDHLVLCVDDLDKAQARYRAMGFTLTPAARHPFGTGNSLVQLEGSFLELLSVVSPELIPPHQGNHFSFAAFNRDFLARHEGFAMLVLDSEDTGGDLAYYEGAGLKAHDPFGFSRKARTPDGEEVEVSFSLAFVSDPATPDAGYFCCHQHNPELFWKAEYQAHANSAFCVADVCLVAEHPLAHEEFLQSFARANDVEVSDAMVKFVTTRGTITVVTPDGFAARYGVAAPDLGHGPRWGAFTVGVRDLVAAKEALQDGRVDFERSGRLVVVPPAKAFGTVIAFELMDM